MGATISESIFAQRIVDKHKGMISLFGDYSGTKNNATFKCNVCGHIWNVNAYSVGNGHGCPECKRINAHNRNAFTFDKVKEYIESFGYLVLSDYYYNSHTMLTLKCECGNVFPMRYNNFHQGNRCPVCQQIKKHIKQRKNTDDIIEIINNSNLEFLGFVGEYTNERSLIITRCKKGHVHTRTYQTIRTNLSCPTCSLELMSERFKGSGSSSWKGGTTKIKDHLRTRLKDWKQKSMESCNYKCVITGGRFDNIHHLYGLNLIMQEALDNLNLNHCKVNGDYSEEELESLEQEIIRLHEKYPLGVCLSKEVHDLFHNNYNYRNNTPEQFEEFKIRYTNGEFTN